MFFAPCLICRMALYESLLFLPQSTHSRGRHTLAITICHYASAMHCVNPSIIFFYLHGAHPCRFCLPRQVSQFVINGVRNIYCNWSNFGGISPRYPPEQQSSSFPPHLHLPWLSLSEPELSTACQRQQVIVFKYPRHCFQLHRMLWSPVPRQRENSIPGFTQWRRDAVEIADAL